MLGKRRCGLRKIKVGDCGLVRRFLWGRLLGRSTWVDLVAQEWVLDRCWVEVEIRWWYIAMNLNFELDVIDSLYFFTSIPTSLCRLAKRRPGWSFATLLTLISPRPQSTAPCCSPRGFSLGTAVLIHSDRDTVVTIVTMLLNSLEFCLVIELQDWLAVQKMSGVTLISLLLSQATVEMDVLRGLLAYTPLLPEARWI